MGDQRRRGGRSRSGRGGRIPRRGEGGGGSGAREESFVSFPLEVTGPIRVAGTLDEGAITAVFSETSDLERRQAEALTAIAARIGEPALGRVAEAANGHREALAQLAREVGVEIANGGEGGGDADLAQAAALAQSAHLGWRRLQQVAYAAGDKRMDRAIKPILREKELQADLLDGILFQSLSRRLYREPEY